MPDQTSLTEAAERILSQLQARNPSVTMHWKTGPDGTWACFSYPQSLAIYANELFQAEKERYNHARTR
jgi:hypothetical protein